MSIPQPSKTQLSTNTTNHHSDSDNGRPPSNSRTTQLDGPHTTIACSNDSPVSPGNTLSTSPIALVHNGAFQGTSEHNDVVCGAMRGDGTMCGGSVAADSFYCTDHIGKKVTVLATYPSLQCQAHTSTGSQCCGRRESDSSVCAIHRPIAADARCVAMTVRGVQCARKRSEGSDRCTQKSHSVGLDPEAPTAPPTSFNVPQSFIAYDPTNKNVGHPCGAMGGDGEECGVNVPPDSISMYCPDHVGKNNVDIVSYPNRQCQACTSGGSRCRNRKAPDSKYCSHHMPIIVPDNERCEGITLMGTRCLRKASDGEGGCFQHSKRNRVTASSEKADVDKKTLLQQSAMDGTSTSPRSGTAQCDGPPTTNKNVGHPCGAMGGDGSVCGVNVLPDSISMYCPSHVGKNNVDIISYPEQQCYACTSDGSKCRYRRAPDSKYCNHHKPIAAPDNERCEGITLKGTRCLRKASDGEDYCFQHSQ